MTQGVSRQREDEDTEKRDDWNDVDAHEAGKPEHESCANRRAQRPLTADEQPQGEDETKSDQPLREVEMCPLPSERHEQNEKCDDKGFAFRLIAVKGVLPSENVIDHEGN